jgi:hypothetical protein
MTTELRLDLPPAAAEFLAGARETCRMDGSRALAVVFPQLARRIGRIGCGPGQVERAFGEILPARAELSAWRVCDVAALDLADAARADGEVLLDLYRHGDMDERIQALRVASLTAIDAGVVSLLEEAHRSNMESHFAAAACDGNLPARAAGHPDFGLAGFNRMLLKCAFVGLPLSRILDAETHANADLSRMLLDLASEREAAGRAVWSDTLEVAAMAPCPGVVARVIGGLEHGDDKQRRAAARALERLRRPDLAPFAAERLPREPRDEIRAILGRIAAKA